jgi:argininosuccinate lyase
MWPLEDRRMDNATRKVLDAVNSSVEFDHRLVRADIACTSAHVAMLGRQGLLNGDDCQVLLQGLQTLIASVAEGRFVLKPSLEDVHTNIEAALEEAIGPVAGRLGLARARNDLAVTALRIWVRERCDLIVTKLSGVVRAFVDQALAHAHTVMPGMTHLQAAQPVSFGHLCMAYAEMYYRDVRRFLQVRSALNESPLGACALAGTSFAIDRHSVARELGFDRPTANSIDSVADRDFVLDFLGACTTASIHSSRFCEDAIIWLTPQFGFLRLPDFLAGSSAIMPHKRNPDALELVRAKSGRIASNLQTVQMVLKGLTLSYSRDLQEDKEATFDSADAICFSLDVMQLVVRHLQVNAQAMEQAANTGFTTSTDYADWLTRARDIPFRKAHHLVSALVAHAQRKGVALADLDDADRHAVDPVLSGADWPRYSAAESMRSRISHGGTAPSCVQQAAQDMTVRLQTLLETYCPGEAQAQ